MLAIIFSFISAVSFAASTEPVTIVALGDSLTDGYGLSKEQAYPQLVQDRFHKDGMTNVKILNAGISGSTSAGAEGRLKWFLKSKPQILLLALGANDGLRGVPPESTRANLLKCIKLAKENNMRVILGGMMLPPNYGKDYTEKFKQMYADIAKSEKVELIPFLLDGVAGVQKLNQEDGIHPNADGHVKVAEIVYRHLKPMVKHY
jgi:acyl-CoA thioesterase I